MREKLADLAHEVWAHWMRYLFSVSIKNEDGSVTIPADKASRWQRQMVTTYSELSEKEKASDREQADKYLAVITPANKSLERKN